MTPDLPTLSTSSPDETQILAGCIGAHLRAGDTLLLQGPIGAGKSHFARALIQSQQRTPEHVPSPTFTLVQTYDTQRGEIWHADLYRLGSPDEVAELGLTDAMETAICLIEWPDRLGHAAPADALMVTFVLAGPSESREITLTGGTPDLRRRIQMALTECAA